MSRRTKRVILGVAATLVVLGGGVALLPRLLFGPRVDYSAVASIKATPEYQDPALLEQAWKLPVAALYKPGLEFQKNGSFCGPTSAVNVLRSLGQPADQASILDGTGVSTWFGVVIPGVTLDELAAVMRKQTGRTVTVLRGLDLAGFRAHLARANDPSRRYVINFHRGPLFGAGGGHHSPIAGYLAERDLVFVLDVNRQYQPWLVSAERLHAAIDTVDPVSKQKRGLLLIE